MDQLWRTLLHAVIQLVLPVFDGSSIGMPEDSQITPQILMRAYSIGAFPMAHGRHGPIDWYAPDPRAVLPLDTFHVPRSLQRRVRQSCYRVTFDHAFEQVMHRCAGPRQHEPDTWISDEIIEAYTKLHQLGIAHSVEAWLPNSSMHNQEGDELVGGLYGVAMGGAFFGESMFYRATDASKVCLVHLVRTLRARGFQLLDVQFSNPHLEQFGIEQVSQAMYLKRLHAALNLPVDWNGTN